MKSVRLRIEATLHLGDFFDEVDCTEVDVHPSKLGVDAPTSLLELIDAIVHFL